MESLQLERTFTASPEQVFDAWTRADLLQAWFAPGEGFEITAEADPRPGGRFRIAMRHVESGAPHVAVGEYLEVDRPRRIVCTWRWEEGDVAGQPETRLSLDFEPDGDGVRLRLTHERFPDGDLRDKHVQGWTSCLDRLVAHFAAA